MKNLKLLQINGAYLTGSFEQLSKVLTWICWLERPLGFLPSDFTLDYVVFIDMKYSNNIRELWKEKKVQNTPKCPKTCLICNLSLQVTTFDDYLMIFLTALTDSQQSKDH